MAGKPDNTQAQIKKYLNSLGSNTPRQYCSAAMVEDPALPSIFSPVAAYQVGSDCHVLFKTGEYDYDDARLLAIAARYKALYRPRSRVVFLSSAPPGHAVTWLGEPTRSAALVAALYHAGQAANPLDAGALQTALLAAVHKLFGVSIARMGEGLAQMDEVLARELMPAWTLGSEGRELIRPLVRGLNRLLRSALDEALPAEEKMAFEPLMAERLRVWKRGPVWHRFQSLEYVEDMLARREAGLSLAYQGLFALNQNPEADVDRIRLRILTAREDPQDPANMPFAAGGSAGSGVRGEFMFARRSMISQQGAAVPDLLWAVAECSACRSRTKFNGEADPLSLYRIGRAMERIKQMLVAGRQAATFYCGRCGQPLGFEHLILAAYAHYLADQDRDLQFLNERRPGRQRTFIQIISAKQADCRALPITEAAVAKVAGRPLTAVGLWQALLRETNNHPVSREFGPGFVGLGLPPLDPVKQNMTIARFHDQLVKEQQGYWPVALAGTGENPPRAPGVDEYPHWLGRLAQKVGDEQGFRLYAFVDMERIEELFIHAAVKLELALKRALDGTLEVRAPDLTTRVDLKRPVNEAVRSGHFPGMFAAREAGLQARRLSRAESALTAIRSYLGARYAVSYNPPTDEVMIESKTRPAATFPLDELVRDWINDQIKTRQMIIARVGG